jgi:peptidoglycan glycosyltransferase
MQKKITNALGVSLGAGQPTVYRQILSESAASKIAEYMYETVQTGTATRAQVRGYTICGKTGSAEISNDKSVNTNAWFTGFIYDDAHPYAISAVVEGGGAGAGLPSELAAKALKAAIDMVG